jgi:hypothetical protein
MQDPAIIAWNIAATIYYKAGHSLWRVGYLNEGTCYIGDSVLYIVSGQQLSKSNL